MTIYTIKPKIMRLKNLFFIVILVMLTSFNFIKSDQPLSSSLGEDIIQFHSKFLFSDSGNVTYFECEDFASDALDNYSIARAPLSFLHCAKELVVNMHDAAVVDTIYTYSNPENRIQIYRAAQRDFIFTFEVTDPLFKLRGDIKPGMTKDLFSRKFHITEPINNNVQIANLEGSMRFMFYFENNKLKRIDSYLYLD
jgi:hypothetical protein